LRRVELPAVTASEWTRCVGDLLYIRGREGGHITHVVIWIGLIGPSTSAVPLIIDSHGSGRAR
jgi:hypothetical protein